MALVSNNPQSLYAIKQRNKMKPGNILVAAVVTDYMWMKQTCNGDRVLNFLSAFSVQFQVKLEFQIQILKVISNPYFLEDWCSTI